MTGMLAESAAYPWAILRERGRGDAGTAGQPAIVAADDGGADISAAGNHERPWKRETATAWTSGLRPARMRTLTVWLMPGGVNDRKLLNQACAAFEKQQSGVRVFLRTVTAEEWTAADAVLPDVALLATGSLNIPERVLVPSRG